MTHLLRIIPDVSLVRGCIVTGTSMAAIDQNTYKAINGDDGGSWSPTSPIDIQGAGMILAGPTVMSGANINASPGSGTSHPILFGKGDALDFFGFHGFTGRIGNSYTIHMPLTEVYVDVATDIFLSLPLGNVLTSTSGVRFLIPLDVYSGTPYFGFFSIVFSVGETHANIPTNLPKARIIGIAADGTVVPQIQPDTSTVDADGFQYFTTPASGSAWYNGGSPQTMSMFCGDTSDPIDTSLYTYYMEIQDESGSDSWVSTGNTYISVSVTYSDIPLLTGRN